jgi:hypothetical protein
MKMCDDCMWIRHHVEFEFLTALSCGMWPRAVLQKLNFYQTMRRQIAPDKSLHVLYIHCDVVSLIWKIYQQNLWWRNRKTCLTILSWWLSRDIGVNLELRRLNLSQTIPRYRQDRFDVTLAAIFADIRHFLVGRNKRANAELEIFLRYI